MLIAGAVCPHPPLLIPAAMGEAGGDPPPELRKVLTACDEALRRLAAAGPELIVVVGGGPATRVYPADAAGGLGEFGAPVVVGEGEPALPLSLTVGSWLLRRAGLGPGAGPPLRWQAVDQRARPGDCVRLGVSLAGLAPAVALLAMGDGSARRAREAPGAPDPLAEEYDEEVAEALAAADTRWLARLDPALDDTLLVAGRAAWQVLAGAGHGRRLHGRLHCVSAPYEVTYLVASWERPAGAPGSPEGP